MSNHRLFQELDYRNTPIGELSLRRRRVQPAGVDVYEIKLGDEYLMSSLFTASEVALGRLGVAEALQPATGGDKLPVAGSETGSLEMAVGGLGLGYTAQAVLEHAAVGAVLVVEALEAVIEWHATGLLPLGPALSCDPRCRFVHGDFFRRAASQDGFDPEAPGRRFDAVLVDIDHSPEMVLDNRNQGFYRVAGLRQVSAHLKPGGIFGLWSNDRPDPEFTARLQAVFGAARAEPVTFHNPLQQREYTQTVYLARQEADGEREGTPA